MEVHDKSMSQVKETVENGMETLDPEGEEVYESAEKVTRRNKEEQSGDVETVCKGGNECMTG